MQQHQNLEIGTSILEENAGDNRGTLLKKSCIMNTFDATEMIVQENTNFDECESKSYLKYLDSECKEVLGILSLLKYVKGLYFFKLCQQVIQSNFSKHTVKIRVDKKYCSLIWSHFSFFGTPKMMVYPTVSHILDLKKYDIIITTWLLQ